MARKNVLKFEASTSQSMASNFISEPTVIKYLDNCSYQILITTIDSTGSFAVQASNDYEPNEPGVAEPNPGNWAALPLSGAPTAGGADDSIVIDLNQLPYTALRVAYTVVTPGTGTCDIIFNSKQVGG